MFWSLPGIACLCRPFLFCSIHSRNIFILLDPSAFDLVCNTTTCSFTIQYLNYSPPLSTPKSSEPKRIAFRLCFVFLDGLVLLNEVDYISIMVDRDAVLDPLNVNTSHLILVDCMRLVMMMHRRTGRR
eukprot:55576_1